jgi:hypothetical protein
LLLLSTISDKAAAAGTLLLFATGTAVTMALRASMVTLTDLLVLFGFSSVSPTSTTGEPSGENSVRVTLKPSVFGSCICT